MSTRISSHLPDRPRHSIRQRLEQDAWRHYPGLVRQRQRQAQEPANKPAHQPANQALDKPARRPAKQVRRPRLNWRDRTLLISWIVLTLLLIVRISTAQADSTGTLAEDQPWGLEFHGDGSSQRSVALNTDIEVDITGLVARINVSQRFVNSGGTWREAIYRFPLPDGAAVDRLQVQAGDLLIEGEIQEKQTARRQYQQARSDGRVSALVEQQRANQFETRLANIAPGVEITVAISFLSQVDYRDGEFALQIPLTFTPRWGTDTTAGASEPAPAPVIQTASALDDRYLSLSIHLQTGLNLARLESRYHDIDIHPTLGGYQLYLADPDTRTDRIFELNWSPDLGHGPASALMTWDGGDAVYAMLMLAPPMVEAIVPQAREVVFIIDTSGSMEGQSLEQARAALYQGLDYLLPEDRFNLIQFNSSSEVLFDTSVPPDAAAMVTAMDFIGGLNANGGTNMSPALHDALSLPQPAADLLRQVVFITDGSVGNETELLQQIGHELGDSRLFTVSIGSAPNTWFMRKAAAIGRGNHTHIGQLDEVEQRMTSLWARIENPALQDICVDWGMPAETYPEVIPDLYAGEPLWLFARLPAEPSVIEVCGDLNGHAWQQTTRPVPGRGSDNLATLWARSKIEALQDSRIFGLDADLIRLQVTALALEHGLLTPYTSLVAVDHSPARPAAENLQSDAIANLLPAGSATSTAGFSATATGWKTQLALSLLCLFIATGMFWYTPPSRQNTAGGLSVTNPPSPDRHNALNGGAAGC